VNLSDSPIEELRIPVQRARVEVHTERDRRTVVLFVAPGASLEDLFEDAAPFFPAEDDGSIRLYARSSIVKVVSEARDVAPPSLAALGVAYHGRTIAVYLANGEVLTGALMSLSGNARTLDLLNQSAKSFALHANGKVHHVAKVYVQRIEELR
jgi:hypothetical protein